MTKNATDRYAIELKFGPTGVFAVNVDRQRLRAEYRAPAPLANLQEEIRQALDRPLDFPSLTESCIADDQVIIALDRHTPHAELLIAEMWRSLSRRGVAPGQVKILQPPSRNEIPLSDPRVLLPEEVREQVGWKIHDPAVPKANAYLASTAAGERIYLAQELANADVVFCVGQISYDPVLGYRGTHSVLYPGLSSTEATQRAVGQGHQELNPRDERPLRQIVDEIGWLLGTQFVVQVIPGANGSPSHVLAGAYDSVLKQGMKLLDREWEIGIEERPELVVAAVGPDTQGHGWEQLGAAAEAARKLVAPGGRILLLSELADLPGEGVNLLRSGESPEDAIRPLRELAPSDLIPATQLADAARWARVFLLSRLPGDLVEELFMAPVETVEEAERLLNGDEASLAVIEMAQYVNVRQSAR